MKSKIIKKICSIGLCFAMLLGVTACGDSADDSTAVKGMISAKPLTAAELGEGFNSDYLPDASSIKQLSGKVDVCLDFEGTQPGWQALAKEYQRLHSNAVVVNINTNFAGSQYAERLNKELPNKSTDWDIVEGNLGYSNVRPNCIDMYSSIQSTNPYAGKNVKWNTVLDRAAYRTKEADNSGESYILNTEVMQTCWFVNDVALREAAELGYKNARGKAEYPITWDDLISLCDYMQQAGYTNPLGITLCNASIESLQFTWLLRVYGDYYYRQFYKYVMAADDAETPDVWDNYDPTASVVENLHGYGFQWAKMLNILFNENTTLKCGYQGFKSELYMDFVGQLAKMNGYLMKDAVYTEFGALRDQFATQSGGKGSPQILLDYQGFGITYEKDESATFELGYFDYPQMITGRYTSGDKKDEYFVDPVTKTRDIGGNGGFLSVVKHGGAQDELNRDFIKFVMSPYGQTIYYKGLAEADAVPKGLSTVNHDLVVIPSEWTSFFNECNKTITFSGDVDANHFLSWGVRYVCGLPATSAVIHELWRNLLGVTGTNITVNAFAAYWNTAVYTDTKEQLTINRWPESVLTDPNVKL